MFLWMVILVLTAGQFTQCAAPYETVPDYEHANAQKINYMYKYKWASMVCVITVNVPQP